MMWEVWWINGLGGDGDPRIPLGLRDMSIVEAETSLEALEMVACRNVTPVKVMKYMG